MLISAKELIRRFTSKCAGESFQVKFLFAATAIMWGVYLSSVFMLHIPMAIRFCSAFELLCAASMGSSYLYCRKISKLLSTHERITYWFGKQEDEIHDKILKTKGRDSAYMN